MTLAVRCFDFGETRPTPLGGPSSLDPRGAKLGLRFAAQQRFQLLEGGIVGKIRAARFFG